MSSIELRYYQYEAIRAAFEHLNTKPTNPCIVIPTGGGKTPVIASMTRKIVSRNGRVMIVSHVKELVEQSANTLRRMAPDLAMSIGVYSAGLKSKDADTPVVVAGVQSAANNAYAFQKIDLLIVDEAHLIPPDGDGQYQTLIKALLTCNPKLRIVGLTATPYRMSSGIICGPDNILNEVCYEVGVRELIVGGYLSKLKSRAGTDRIDFSGVSHRGGEFVESEMQDLMNQDHLVASAVNDILTQAHNRKSVLLFCSGVQHAQHVARVLREASGLEVGEVYGETPSNERASTIQRFKNGSLRYLVNVAVLTTGFDAPNVDCVCLLRATESPGLYYQMVGRGFRLAPNKEDCLVLDFGGNVMRHGPVDMIEVKNKSQKSGEGTPPTKECPACHALVHISCTVCTECGAEFPVQPKAPHEDRAGNASIISGEIEEHDLEVYEVDYAVHTKKDAPPNHPKTLRVTYKCGILERHSEWICVEHPIGSFPRNAAEKWWEARSPNPCPTSAEDAMNAAKFGSFRTTTHIKIRKVSGEKYSKVVGYVLGDMNSADGKCESCGSSDREWIENQSMGKAQVLEVCKGCGMVFRTVPDAEASLSPDAIQKPAVIADDDIPF